MGFQPIAAAPGRKTEEVVVSIKRHVGHLGRVRVSIHAEVIRAIGWTPGILIEPMIGDGPDHGLIMLRPAVKSGFKLGKPGGRSERSEIMFRAPQGSPDKHAGQPAEYTINRTERSMKIRLPWTPRAASLRAAE